MENMLTINIFVCVLMLDYNVFKYRIVLKKTSKIWFMYTFFLNLRTIFLVIRDLFIVLA